MIELVSLNELARIASRSPQSVMRRFKKAGVFPEFTLRGGSRVTPLFLASSIPALIEKLGEKFDREKPKQPQGDQ